MPKPKTNVITGAAVRGRLTGKKKQRRDAKILRLWSLKWPAKKIAGYLDITAGLVRNVVHANGAARKPRRQIVTVGAEDAPIEAWQQAMLPKLEKAADAMGMSDASKRATIFLGLLRHRPYDDIRAFKTWVHQVTGYQPDEIDTFVERGTKSFLIIDGQPNDEAFQAVAEADDGTGYMEFVLMAGVLEGRFCRTADGKYRLPEEAV